MSVEKKIYKPSPISGFPEWLPEERMIEQTWQDHIRSIFERYGFCSIETPAVEKLDVISAKGGDADKEIYVLERLQADPDEKKEAKLALHFDQTVPFARYVAQNFNELVFPFKRYQMQKVWRGERPQAGRFREFMQCDIDVINIDNLPLHFDAEIPSIIWEVLSTLPGMNNENIQLQISNRKILIGLLQALDIANIVEVTRIIDKLGKIGEGQVNHLLKEHGISEEKCSSILALANIKSSDDSFVQDIEKIGVSNAIMQEGIQELEFVIQQLGHLPQNSVIADLSIVRGLDYYTGTVYETVFLDDPHYGSICSGGRYDDLAGSYINKNLPGVGISIGFSRLFDRLRTQGKLPKGKQSYADILVALPEEEQRPQMNEVARILRQRGYNVETAHGGKLKKQLSMAEKKGIRYVWFPADNQVKDMLEQKQEDADPNNWSIETKQ